MKNLLKKLIPHIRAFMSAVYEILFSPDLMVTVDEGEEFDEFTAEGVSFDDIYDTVNNPAYGHFAGNTCHSMFEATHSFSL